MTAKAPLSLCALLLACACPSRGAMIDTTIASDFLVITTSNSDNTTFNDSNGVLGGVSGDANVAITNPNDEAEFSNTAITADPAVGIQIARASGGVSTSNATFNGGPLLSGVTFGFDPTALLGELAAARTEINGLAATSTLVLGGGNFASASFAAGSTASLAVSGAAIAINLAPGLNVIDLDAGSDSILLDNATLTVDGPSGSIAVFRFDADNFLISNGEIGPGSGGIAPNSLLFYTDQDSNDEVFNFSDTVLNGVSFWSLGDEGGVATVQNSDGTAQFIADEVLFSNVVFDRGAFVGAIPEPATTFLLMTLFVACGVNRRRG